MNKFFNFKFLKRALDLIVYVCIMVVLIFDGIRHSESWISTGDHHYLAWWTLFLVLDIWYFRKDKDSDD